MLVWEVAAAGGDDDRSWALANQLIPRAPLLSVSGLEPVVGSILVAVEEALNLLVAAGSLVRLAASKLSWLMSWSEASPHKR